MTMSVNIEMSVSVNGRWKFSDFSSCGFVGHNLIIDTRYGHVKVTMPNGVLYAPISSNDIVGIEFKESDS